MSNTKTLDRLLEAFSAEMKHELHRAAHEGKSGWDDPENIRYYAEKLNDFIDKIWWEDGVPGSCNIQDGKFINAANWLMFLWYHKLKDNRKPKKPKVSGPEYEFIW